MNRENLEKLASYLEGLPTNYQHFGMQSFLCQDGHLYSYADTAPIAGDCGTVACAVGHGPAAGIPAVHGNESWNAYAERAFDLNHDQWLWCFDGDWMHVDDTSQGAAKRIRHLLEHGLPEDPIEQCWGMSPYLFAQETVA